jgi:hypothetical protein
MDREFQKFKKTVAEAVMAHVAKGGHIVPLADRKCAIWDRCRCPIGCVISDHYPPADIAAEYVPIEEHKLESFMFGFDGNDAVNVDVQYWSLGREYREQFAPEAP